MQSHLKSGLDNNSFCCTIELSEQQGDWCKLFSRKNCCFYSFNPTRDCIVGRGNQIILQKNFVSPRLRQSGLPCPHYKGGCQLIPNKRLAGFLTSGGYRQGGKKVDEKKPEIPRALRRSQKAPALWEEAKKLNKNQKQSRAKCWKSQTNNRNKQTIKYRFSKNELNQAKSCHLNLNFYVEKIQ